MRTPSRVPGRLLPTIASLLFAVGLAACATSTGERSAGVASPSDVPPGAATTKSPTAADGSPGDTAQASEAPGASDAGGGTTSGDVPDNAVFLTHHDPRGFSIDYVQGWQVSTASDGVVIRDKDSFETVSIVALPRDVGSFVSGTDLPALQAMSGFTLSRQDTVKVGSQTLIHLQYHLPAPADPVTGKRVPSIVDRYYVPGASGLAIVSLSTPDGVDNVDAFRQMIESFVWK